ncbi:MAG: hypothetical protein HXS47_11595 [Theionarchaea archaeon]|nr:hypothetical protein [Theionarchaea archaeon]
MIVIKKPLDRATKGGKEPIQQDTGVEICTIEYKKKREKPPFKKSSGNAPILWSIPWVLPHPSPPWAETKSTFKREGKEVNAGKGFSFIWKEYRGFY